MMKVRWIIYLEVLAVKLIGQFLVKQKLYKNITGLRNETRLKALAHAKFRIFPLIRPFGRLYSLRLFFTKENELFTYS